MSLALNAIRASSVRLLTPWSGAWVADVELDLGELPDLPTGPAILKVKDAPLKGTIDPKQSGKFGPARARARVVGGGGGWEKTVSAQHYHNDAGVLSTAVLSTTAAEVGEVVVESKPARLGVDVVRAVGPASRVLAGAAWYLELATGATIVGPRVRLPAPPTLQILDWDARTKVATIATDDIVAPGTILKDERFGQAVVRDVEQTWSDGSARATAWTMPLDANPLAPGAELVAAVAAVAREAAGVPYLKVYRYRVVIQGPDGRLNLQAVKKTRGVPDLKAISLAPAVPGMKVKVTPGTIVHVAFVDGDRSQPVVVRFESQKPLEVTFDATVRVVVGGELAAPVALAAPTLAALTAVGTAVAGIFTALQGLGVPGTGAAAKTLADAITTAGTAAPAKKLFAE